MSISYLNQQINKLKSQKKKNDTIDALEGALNGKFIHGKRNPDINYPIWITKKVAPGGFMCGIKYKLKETENNANILNDHSKMSYYAELIEYITHNLDGPEPLMIPCISLLEKMGKIKEANELKEIIRPYINNIRFYPIDEEIMTNKKKPNVFASLETISDFISWTEDYINKNTFKLEQNNIIHKKITLELEIIELFNESKSNYEYKDWPMQNISKNWLIKAQELYKNNHWYDIKHKRKRGILYNLWIILKKVILQKDFRNNYINTINGLDVCRIKYYLSCSKLKKYIDINSNRINIQNKIQSTKNLVSFLEESKETHIEEIMYENIKNNYNIEEIVLDKLNKCVLYPLEKLRDLGYIPSSEIFVELSKPMEAFLQTIDFDFKEDVTTEEHLKYLIYKAFKNMRSLLLFNLESQLKLHEIPQYNILNKVFQSNKTSSNKLIVTKLLLSYYVKWFPGDQMPNRIVKMLYNLLKSEDTQLGLCEEIACDIFQRKFGIKYDISLNIAQKYMKNTLYSLYYEIDDLYKLNSSLTKLSLSLKDKYYSNSSSYIDFNGQQLQASMILTTHNNIQLSNFISDINYNLILKTITYKLLNLLNTDNIEPLTISQIGHCWRNFMYYISKCSNCEITKYLHWIICKIIWYNICNNKNSYLNIDNEVPLFIKDTLNTTLYDLSSNNNYVTFKDIWKELNLKTNNEFQVFTKFTHYTKYLKKNKLNKRFFGLFISSLVTNYIQYFNIYKYYNIFNNKNIILGWIQYGSKHDITNELIYNNKFEEFINSCEKINKLDKFR